MQRFHFWVIHLSQQWFFGKFAELPFCLVLGVFSCFWNRLTTQEKWPSCKYTKKPLLSKMSNSEVKLLLTVCSVILIRSRLYFFFYYVYMYIHTYKHIIEKGIYIYKLRERKVKKFSLSFPLICDFRTSVLSFPRGLYIYIYIYLTASLV